MKRTLIILAYLLIAGLFYLAFDFIADFSVPQSIVLALLLAWIVLWIDNTAARPTLRFSPYYISVTPKWFELLTDFKLIGKPEDWRAILESFEKLPFTEYHVLRHGIYFTIVHESKDFEGKLIYVYHRHDFVSKVDFEEGMDPIKVEREHEFPDLRTSEVRFFMKSGPDGYNLGMVFPDWWWKQMKQSCPAPLKEHIDYPTGQVELTLATVPYLEFDFYWWPGGRRDYFDKTARNITTRRDQQREKLGWKIVQHPDLPELAINWAESIEHKYFEVKHREI